jgi:hypothetical protein
MPTDYLETPAQGKLQIWVVLFCREKKVKNFFSACQMPKLNQLSKCMVLKIIWGIINYLGMNNYKLII